MKRSLVKWGPLAALLWGMGTGGAAPWAQSGPIVPPPPPVPAFGARLPSPGLPSTYLPAIRRLSEEIESLARHPAKRAA